MVLVVSNIWPRFTRCKRSRKALYLACYQFASDHHSTRADFCNEYIEFNRRRSRRVKELLKWQVIAFVPCVEWVEIKWILQTYLGLLVIWVAQTGEGAHTCIPTVISRAAANDGGELRISLDAMFSSREWRCMLWIMVGYTMRGSTQHSSISFVALLCIHTTFTFYLVAHLVCIEFPPQLPHPAIHAHCMTERVV